MSFSTQIPTATVQNLQNLFIMFDADRSNTLSYPEFAALLAHAGYQFLPHELLHLQYICDSSKTGHIRLADWIEAGSYIVLSEGVFHQVDADKSGAIEPLELGHALLLQGYKWDVNQINYFFQKFNTSKTNRMTVTEWLKLSIFVLACRVIFNLADTLKTGSLSFMQFWPVLAHLGINVDQAQAQHIFLQVDTDRSGSIELSEFIFMMAQLPV